MPLNRGFVRSSRPITIIIIHVHTDATDPDPDPDPDPDGTQQSFLYMSIISRTVWYVVYTQAIFSPQTADIFAPNRKAEFTHVYLGKSLCFLDI